MAEKEEGVWVEDVGGGNSVSDLVVKTISGHAYRIGIADCNFWYSLRTDTPWFTVGRDVKDFRSDIIFITLDQDGEDVDWDALPEQEQAEIEASIDARLLERLDEHLTECWPSAPFRSVA